MIAYLSLDLMAFFCNQICFLQSRDNTGAKFLAFIKFVETFFL